MAFKVIDGDGPGKEERDRERDREWAQDEFSWAIRDCAANMLRIIRGAGKPYELLAQMQKAIDNAIKFQELHGYWPYDVIANDLRVEDEMQAVLERGREGKLDQATIDRWWKDGTFDRMRAEHTMYRGALQTIASQLIGQNTQQRSGKTEFNEGFRQLEQSREDRRQRERAEAIASRRAAPPKQKPRTASRKRAAILPSPSKPRSL